MRDAFPCGVALFARKRSPAEIRDDLPRGEPPLPRRLPELDAFSRRHLEEVCRRADALAASLDAKPAPPKPAPPKPAPPRRPAFEDAPTDPFIPVDAAPLRLVAEQEDIDDIPIVEEEVGSVIVDEELLHAQEPETTPCGRVPAHLPDR